MKYLLGVTVFICGAVVMILELAGSRIIAPYLGTSIFVWTSLIGIILLSLSIGYWWGGRLADKNPRLVDLGRIILAAGILIAAIILFKPVLASLSLFSNIRFGAVIASIILFTPATIFLGMVTPYVARLSLETVDTAGRTIGALYALSTVGSIIGTFLGGFLLISYFGSTDILVFLAGILILLSTVLFLFSTKRITKLHIAAFFILIISAMYAPSGILLPAEASLVADVDTNYSRVWVFDLTNINGDRVRYLSNILGGVQSGLNLDNPSEVLFDYLRTFDLTHTIIKPQRALIVGAAGYTYPRHFLKENPNATIDVVELDPGMTEIAQKYFFLKPDERMVIHHMDGRTFLNTSKEQYDAIFLDAFHTSVSIPHHLTTVEAIERVHNLLTPGGIAVSNIISSLTGPASEFFRSELATYQQVFSHVYILQARPTPEHQVQNITIFGIKEGVSENALRALEQQPHIIKPERQHALILTDEFAPTERMTAIFTLSL